MNLDNDEFNTKKVLQKQLELGTMDLVAQSDAYGKAAEMRESEYGWISHEFGYWNNYIIGANSSMFDTNFSPNYPIAYIITPDFHRAHIQPLVSEFDRNFIPYNLQKETDTLGQPLDKRYFVIADNAEGPVTLGAEFSSLLMYMVGYPRPGANKKNYYCTKPSEVVQRYMLFRKLPQLEKTNFSTHSIKSKSQLKTIKSLPRSKQGSILIQNRSQSINSKMSLQSIKLRSFTQANEDSKVFLMRSVIPASKNKSLIEYNKSLSKIAVRNPNKYKIVQNFSELKSCLETCIAPSHYLLVNEENMSLLNNLLNENLRIFVYSPAAKAVMKQDEQNSRNERFTFVTSVDQIVEEVEKSAIITEKSKINLRKGTDSDQNSKIKQKAVVWASTNDQFKIGSSMQSPHQASQHYSTKFYPQSQNIIGQVCPKEASNLLLSRTEPEAKNNVFTENCQKQQKALEEIEKQYYNINQPRNMKTIRPRTLSLCQEQQVINLKIAQQNKLAAPQDQIKQTIVLKTIELSKPRRVIKKIKRINSQNIFEKLRKEVKPEDKLEQPTLKLVQRKFVLPEQYCSPISPATQCFDQKQMIRQPTATGVQKRMIRCYSEQPEIKYIYQQDVQTENKAKLAEEPHKLFMQRPSKRSQQAQIRSTNLSQMNKKSQLLLSTAGTEANCSLLIESQPDYELKTRESKITISQKRESMESLNAQTGRFGQNLSAFSTFGNLKPSRLKSTHQTISSNNECIQTKSPNLDPNVNVKYNPNNQSQPLQKMGHQITSPLSVKKKKLTKPICILWKQFNFDIEQGINQINKQLDIDNLRQHSFYRFNEVQKIIQALPHSCLLIFMLDDTDLSKFLNVIHKSVSTQNAEYTENSINRILAIYVYPKSEDQFPTGQKPKGHELIKPHLPSSSDISHKVKFVSGSDYYQNYKYASKRIMNLILSTTENEEKNQI